MSEALDLLASKAVDRMQQLVELYEGQSDVSLHDHVRAKRKERVVSAKAFRLIYLDTNAWKCIADFDVGKTTLTAEMEYFAKMMELAKKSGDFAFPISASTLFEMDAMTDSVTRDSMCRIADQLSKGFCIIPLTERFDTELRQLKSNKLNANEGLDAFLCSPTELLGIPEFSVGGFWPVNKLTYDKALFDVLSEMPFSTLLEVTREKQGRKWDNSRGVDEENIRKSKLQVLELNLNTAVAIELRDLIGAWFKDIDVEMSTQDLNQYVFRAMQYWQENENTKAMPTLRSLSSIRGLMLLDPQRKFQKGDINDFMIAASALPVASAFFTDRKLKNLIKDKRIGIDHYSGCEVVSGFADMGLYLEQAL
jgi:hypothetical protein